MSFYTSSNGVLGVFCGVSPLFLMFLVPLEMSAMCFIAFWVCLVTVLQHFTSFNIHFIVFWHFSVSLTPWKPLKIPRLCFVMFHVLHDDFMACLGCFSALCFPDYYKLLGLNLKLTVTSGIKIQFLYSSGSGNFNSL